MNDAAFLKSLRRRIAQTFRDESAGKIQTLLESVLLRQMAMERGVALPVELQEYLPARKLEELLAAEASRRGQLPLEWLGLCYEQHQAELIDEERQRARRKGVGVYYTPAEVVRFICRETLREEEGPQRVIDPACGCGVFLLEALSQSRRVEDIYGIDIDPHAVQLARIGLHLAAAEKSHDVEAIWQTVQQNIVCADALMNRKLFPEVAAAGGFSAVISNPPYVNIRLLTQQRGRSALDALARYYHTARGKFDLYVLFVERAFQLLREGGRCGMIVPNKLATLDYAEPCRELLLGRTSLESITDLSQCHVFQQAGVFVVVWSKGKPSEEQRCRIAAVASVDHLKELEPDDFTTVPQASWSAKSGFTLQRSLDVESRVPTLPLGEFARVETGSTGFRAQRVADALRERDSLPAAEAACGFPFLVSRNIDRYRVTLGRTRFAGQVFNLPLLPHDSPAISDGKRELYAGRKIVLAGLSQHLEAAHDPGGYALGVQTFAIVLPAETDDEVWWYLLGVLNSQLLSYLFRTRFAAKQLAGGYLAINKGQLARLPIRIVAPDDAVAVELCDRIATLAREATEQGCSTEIDAEIDRCVLSLYHVDPREIEPSPQFTGGSLRLDRQPPIR